MLRLLVALSFLLACALPVRAQMMTGVPPGALSPDAARAQFGGGALPPQLMAPPAIPTIRNTMLPAQQPAAVQPAPDAVRAQPRMPEAKTEFQEFVEKSIGRTLPLFGANLFSDAPSTFAPIVDLPVTPDYVIGPGDEVVIRAWGAIDVDYRAVVDRSGAISIPRIGSIQLAGQRHADLERVIRQHVGRVYKNFELTATLGQIRSIRVYVVGSAQRPGAYTVSSLATLVNAVFAAGGPSATGSLRRIELRRAGQVVTRFDFYDLLLRGDKSKDVRLASEDVIWIGPMGQQAAIAGSVNQPAIFELAPASTLDDLIGWAGGLASTALGQRITLERIADRRERQVLELDASAVSRARALADGDLVTVYAIHRRFENAVTLRGNVARPMRFAFKPGMKVSDLIPDRAALITDDFYLSREQAVLPNVIANDVDGSTLVREPDGRFRRVPRRVGPNGQPLPPALDDTANADRQTVSEQQFRNEMRRTLREPNWEYAAIERLRENDLSPEIVPFNLGRAVLERDPQHDLALRPGDVVTVFSRDDLAVSGDKQTKFVRLEGEFVSPGIYRALPGETLRQLVIRLGGLTRAGYLYGAEFTRDSTRREQQARYEEALRRFEQDIARAAITTNAASGEDAAILKQQQEARSRMLERMRQAKPTGRIVLGLASPEVGLKDLPDLPLQDGDRLFVPARPDSVSVYGSVFNEGSFVFEPQQRVGDFLGRAGGPTRSADRRSTFVIRASGVVESSRQSSWLGGVEGSIAHAGDTIVVPEDFERQPFMKTLRDWTQVLYQFGLGAAAVRVLRN